MALLRFAAAIILVISCFSSNPQGQLRISHFYPTQGPWLLTEIYSLVH